MYFASLWPGQSFLLLLLATHMCSSGMLGITGREVNPGFPRHD